jgi:NADP-dependent 3-hydroxy acid dehydrogenase YdfG
MTARTWLITGVSSGFGRELASQLLTRGDRVIGTVRDASRIVDLTDRYPDTFIPEMLEMTDSAAVRHLIDRTFGQRGRVDVIVSNAGYGLFGAAHHADPRSTATPTQSRRRPGHPDLVLWRPGGLRR